MFSNCGNVNVISILLPILATDGLGRLVYGNEEEEESLPAAWSRWMCSSSRWCISNAIVVASSSPLELLVDLHSDMEKREVVVAMKVAVARDFQLNGSLLLGLPEEEARMSGRMAVER
jgi:hypothetical protein